MNNLSSIFIPKHVQIIDDDLDDQMLLEEALLEINADMTFYKSSNGKEGLSSLQNVNMPRPDIIFADLNMPSMNGRQFLFQIMQDPQLNTIPVVIYSTAFDTVEVDLVLKLGASAFLQKPNDFKMLVEKLKEKLISIMMNNHPLL